jgi:hypothetical protein
MRYTRDMPAHDTSVKSDRFLRPLKRRSDGKVWLYAVYVNGEFKGQVRRSKRGWWLAIYVSAHDGTLTGENWYPSAKLAAHAVANTPSLAELRKEPHA